MTTLTDRPSDIERLELSTIAHKDTRTVRLGVGGDGFTLGVFTLLYALHVVPPAVTRAFWLDELFTYYIVTMPDWGGMFDLIRRGPDQNPPLFYILTRLTVGVFGESEWAFRLPAMAGYWVFCAALYGWVRLLGGGRTAALVALVTPTLTPAAYYAGEARPYGLILGGVGLGLVCWQLTRQLRRRGLGLVGLGLSLSLTAALHYLALLPIGVLWVVEGLVSWRARTIDRIRWAAMSTPLPILPIHWPFFYQQAQQGFWKITLTWRELADFYQWLIGSPTYLALCAVVGLLALWRRRTAAQAPSPPQSDAGTERRGDDFIWPATSLGFLLLPLFWMLLLKTTRQTAFQDRYFLSAVIGLGGVAAYGLRRLPTRQAATATAAVWCLMGVPAVAVAMQPWRFAPPSVAEIVALPKPEYPVVAAAHLYFPIQHYYPGRFDQLIYVAPQKRPAADAASGLWALQRHPRAPDWLDENEFFSRWAGDFYFVCHKTYMRHWFDEFRRRGYPVVRETPNYVVYEWRRKQ